MYYGIVTETEDFIDSFYYAIPKEFRPLPRKLGGPRLGLHEKLTLVFKYWDKINIEQAMLNLVDNEAGDTIGGQVGNQAREANKLLGRPVGIQFGPLH